MYDHMIVALTLRDRRGTSSNRQPASFHPKSQADSDALIEALRTDGRYVDVWTLNGYGQVSRFIKGEPHSLHDMERSPYSRY